MSEQEDDQGPLLSSVVSVAAVQLTGAAVRAAKRAARKALRAGGANSAAVEIRHLHEWEDLSDQIEALILAGWAAAAEDIERTMRAHGIDPEEVAERRVPVEVVPS